MEEAEKNAVREILEKTHGAANVWTTDEMRDQFEVSGFVAGVCIVRKKSTGEKGSLEFTHHPRFYYKFVADR